MLFVNNSGFSRNYTIMIHSPRNAQENPRSYGTYMPGSWCSGVGVFGPYYLGSSSSGGSHTKMFFPIDLH